MCKMITCGLSRLQLRRKKYSANNIERGNLPAGGWLYIDCDAQLATSMLSFAFSYVCLGPIMKQLSIWNSCPFLYNLYETSFQKLELVLTWVILHFVGWVEPIPGFFGFRCTQPNLHFVGAIANCETQQWPISEPSPKSFFLDQTGCSRPAAGLTPKTWSLHSDYKELSTAGNQQP